MGPCLIGVDITSLCAGSRGSPAADLELPTFDHLAGIEAAGIIRNRWARGLGLPCAIGPDMSPRHLPVPFVLMLALMLCPQLVHAAPTMSAAPPAAVAAPAPKMAALPAPKTIAPALAAEPVHAAPAAPLATTPISSPAITNNNIKSRDLHLGRLYFKSTSEVGADGVTKSTRSWGLSSKADGTGRSFDRSTQAEHGADGAPASRMTTMTLGKLDAKGNSTQRTWSKDTTSDSSGAYKDSSKITLKTTANDDGSKSLSEKRTSDTRLTGTDGAVARDVIKLTRTTDGKTGVVSTTVTKKSTGATAAIAPAALPPATARESNETELSAVGIAKSVDAKGTIRFRDTATGRFVSASDADKRLQPVVAEK